MSSFRLPSQPRQRPGLGCFFAGLMFFSVATFASDSSGQLLAHVAPASPLTTGLNFNYFPVALKSYEWKPGRQLSKTGHALSLEVEWLAFADLWGKPAIGTSFGYQYLEQVGRRGRLAQLHVFPVGLFFSYRFDYFRRQWLVPYVKAGGSVIFSQRSTGGHIENSRNWDYGAGLSLSLGSLDPYSVRHLDASTGINDFFLTVEYVKSTPMSRNELPNVGHEEFRFGIRFEI